MDNGSQIIQLIDARPEEAWRRLVDEYSVLILAVISRYTINTDDRMDAYLYVLEELANNDMRRIRRYGQGEVERPCQFSTWLKLVVRNLYFDWFRHRHGRKSVPKEIQKLGEIDQRIFRLVYWERYRPREAFEVLRTGGMEVTYERFLEGLSEVDGRLTGINRAKIRRDYLKHAGPISLDLDYDSGPPVEAQADVERTDAIDTVDSAERLAVLSKLLDALEPEDRLLLRLRFYEGLTAREIAEATGCDDPMAVYRRIDRICNELQTKARVEGVDQVLRGGAHKDLADSGLPEALDIDLPGGAARVVGRHREDG